MTTILNRMEALCFRLFLKGVRMIGLERASAIGGQVFRLIGPSSRHHRKILKNLKIAFPARESIWHKRMASAVWQDFGRGLADTLSCPNCAGPPPARGSHSSITPAPMPWAKRAGRLCSLPRIRPTGTCRLSSAERSDGR